MRIKKEDLYDSRSFGQVIKKLWETKNWMRERIAEMVYLASRYRKSIEGRHPCFQSFYELMTLLHSSVCNYKGLNNDYKTREYSDGGSRITKII